MVDYPIVRFVAGPGDTVARLDLNDNAPFTVDHDGFSFGVPELDVDPLAQGVPYGEATTELTVTAEGDTATVVPALSALAIEIQRWKNWLMYQHDAASKPFWMRTYPSAPQALNLEDVYLDRATSQWRVPVTLRREAFVREAEVSLAPVVVGNDPSTGGMVVELTGIEGDSPAPLNVLMETNDSDMSAPLVSTSASDEAWTAPLVVTSWAVAILNGQPTFTSNAAYVAGGYWSLPGSGGDQWPATVIVTPPFAGRYKALLRVGFDDSASEFDLDMGDERVRVTERTLGGSEPWRWWGGTNTQGWIDMGTVTLGGGWNPVLNPTLETDVDLTVTRLTGNGDIRIDSVLFIPVDADENTVEGRTVKTDAMLLTIGDRKFYSDSEARIFSASYFFNDVGPWSSFVVPGTSGRYPQVVPGRTNWLHLVRNVNTGDDTKGDSTTVIMSYFPRRLYPLGLA